MLGESLRTVVPASGSGQMKFEIHLRDVVRQFRKRKSICIE